MTAQADVVAVRPETRDEQNPVEAGVDDDSVSVTTVTSEEAALAAISTAEPAALICDHAPGDGLDGLALVERVRSQYPDLSVFLCTDEPDGRVAARATQLGVTEYVIRSETDPVTRVRPDRGENSLGITEALQELAQLATDNTLTDDEMIKRVLSIGAEQLDLSLGYLSRIEDDRYEIVHVVGDHDVVKPEVETALSNTYCSRTIQTDGLLDIHDVAAEGWDDRPAYEMSGLACYIGGEVSVNGELYGTICFADEAARENPFDETQRAFIEQLIAWVSRELERRQRERELERYEDIIEAVDDGVYALDSDGCFTVVNEGMTELTGYDEAELLGAHTSLIKADRVVAETEQIVREMIFEDRDDEVTVELEIKQADGESIPAEDHMAALWDDSGDWFEGTAGVIRDMAKWAERDQRLSGLLETTRALMQARTAEAVAESIVDAAENQLGFEMNLVRLVDSESGQLEPIAWSDPVPERPVYDETEGFPGEALQHGETLRIDDFEAVENYDDDRINATMYVPLGDHGVLSVGTTDAERFADADVAIAEILASNAAAALSRVERERDLRRYESVIENVREMVYVLDDNGVFQIVTEPLAEWLGYEPGELLGNRPRAVLDDQSASAFEQHVKDTREGGTVKMETELGTVGGDPRPAQIEMSTIHDGVFSGTVGVVRDLTELQRTRAELRDERDRFSYLFDNLPDAVVETEFTGDEAIVRSVNPAFTDVFGYEETDVLDEELGDRLLPPSDDARAQAAQLNEASAAGNVVQAEVRRRTATGFRDFLYRGVPYRREDGRVWSFGIYTDITEQRERERRLEVLNRVLRHNLRNDLTVVLGLADELSNRIEDETLLSLLDQLQHKASEIATLSDRAREIEQSVHREESTAEPVDVVEVVSSLTATYRQQFEADIETTLPDQEVLAADSRFGRLIDELLENSVEHASDPTIRVDVEATGEMVTITVADDGPGIPDHELEVVTGNASITQLSHGSGLGLWLVIWVAESYGGTVTFGESEHGGAKTVLAIPQSDS